MNRGCGSVHAFEVRRAIDADPGGVASRGEVHEVKFDGYRSQLVIEDDGTRVFTRNGHDWTEEYRDLVPRVLAPTAPTSMARSSC
ncbi:hypothetical protein [Mesorhizobium sp. M0460]|uniref:ATP-dependent DNA ligase n=1 Tax=unclassified Mesorhizobium TaxID=325217 RepID=UPI0033369DAD